MTNGSIAVGYARSARSEPRFESAYSHHGDAPGRDWLNHDWTSGPVEASTTYGSPIAAVSTAISRKAGASAPTGFQLPGGRIGDRPSTTKAAITITVPASTTPCRRRCASCARLRMITWA